MDQDRCHGYENGEWAAVKMIGQNNTWPVTVPESLAAGKYVFRHEIIALHSAGQENGAQAYPQCLNIEVTGSGTDKPEGVVGTSLYKADDAGIKFNVYGGDIKYEIPGPALYSGASGSGSTAPKPSATAPAATSAAASATAPAATSAAAEATPSAAPAPSAGASLPKTFTLDTFVAWLEKTAGESKNARRHARSLF